MVSPSVLAYVSNVLRQRLVSDCGAASAERTLLTALAAADPDDEDEDAAGASLYMTLRRGIGHTIIPIGAGVA